MIIIAGFQYMYQESIDGKSDAKQRITNAFIGLFVMLGSYILLKTINPDLVNFDVTLKGGTGKLAGLTAAQQRTDAAASYAALALTNLPALSTQITTLQKTRDDLQTKYNDILAANAGELTNEKVMAAQAELDAVNSEIDLSVIAKANYQTTASPIRSLTAIDENLLNIASGSDNAKGNAANITAYADGANKVFDSALADLNNLNQNDPEVKKAIAITVARKESVNTEFNEQKLMNDLFPWNSTSILYGATEAQANDYKYAKDNIINIISSNIELQTNQLKSAGLPDEANAFATRAESRLASVCKYLGKTCSK
jgi:hypothetical protein